MTANHVLKKYTLCTVYKTPSEIVEDINNITTEFATLLSHMKAIRQSSYVCGDYNIDLLKVKRNKHYCEYFDEIISQGFIPKITLPTRISEHDNDNDNDKCFIKHKCIQ